MNFEYRLGADPCKSLHAHNFCLYSIDETIERSEVPTMVSLKLKATVLAATFAGLLHKAFGDPGRSME